MEGQFAQSIDCGSERRFDAFDATDNALRCV
jgi:hypothetical protein